MPPLPPALAVEQAAGASSLVAFATVDDALQIVEVDDVAVALALALVEDLLHLQEGFFGDQRLVSARIETALVADDPGVIRIAQDSRQTTVAYWSFGP